MKTGSSTIGAISWEFWYGRICQAVMSTSWGDMPDINKSKESTDQFETELKRMIETKYNHPSIIMWVPFNEGWGQFETGRITDLISDYDSTRLVNSSIGMDRQRYR